MRIIARKTIRDYQTKYPQAAQALETWFQITKEAEWRNPSEIKEQFGSASILNNHRVVFNIGGNNYRLSVYVAYIPQFVYIRFFGTHKEYDKINAEVI